MLPGGHFFVWEVLWILERRKQRRRCPKERREILEVCFETQTMHKVPIFNFRINNKLRRNVSMSLSLGLGKKRVLCCPNVSVPKGKAWNFVRDIKHWNLNIICHCFVGNVKANLVHSTSFDRDWSSSRFQFENKDLAIIQAKQTSFRRRNTLARKDKKNYSGQLAVQI